MSLYFKSSSELKKGISSNYDGVPLFISIREYSLPDGMQTAQSGRQVTPSGSTVQEDAGRLSVKR